MNLKKQLIDQGAHFAAALFLLAPLIAWPCWFTAMFAGTGYGLVREMTEEGKIDLEALKAVFGSNNSLLDIAFWSLGGLAAWLLFS